jgi:NAD(P)-dependent dehydrogenase (short-subunit alcohol dehydrogenase family)
MRFENRVAVVTGGASGIGLATVRGLVAEGARVVAVDRSAQSLSESFDGLEAVAQRPVDVTRSADVDLAVGAAVEEFGRLDVLVTAAGIAQPSRQRTTEFGGDITEITDEDFAEVVEVNLYGTFYALRAAVPAMRRNGAAGGSIITISSVGALAVVPLVLPYPASKAGVTGLTRAAAARLAAENIRVNAVAPGSVDTPMLAMNGPAARQAIIDLAPMKRMATPEEIAATILFLASDDAAFYTGQTISPNGGFWG